MDIKELLENEEPAFEVGDHVVTKSPRLSHFRMIIASINENGTYTCNFGFTQNYAGNFFGRELKKIPKVPA